MKNFFALAFSIFALVNLSGCMTAEEARAKYNSMPASKLCMDYLTYPSYNVWQEDRASAIARRSLDCTPYVAQARAKIQADAEFMNALATINALNTNTSTGYSTSSGPTYLLSTSYVSGTNRICIYKFGASEKIMTMSGIGLCPPSY